MYTEYVEEAGGDVFINEPVERTSDIQLPLVINYLLLVAWVIICLIGFAIMFLAKRPVMGGIVIGASTFCIMIIKPSFALCVLMLVLPTGAGIAAGGVFSLDRGIAIAVVASFMFNLVLSRPSLRVRNKALWIFVVYTTWIFLISFTSPYWNIEILNAFTVIQLAGFSFIVYWIIETNSISTFCWILRSFVVGSLGVIALTHITGTATQLMKGEHTSGGRYSATLGAGIDSNFLAVLIGLAFLTAVYLMASDKNFLFRIIYFIAIVILPIMMLRAGSRGALVAMFVTMTSPFLFIKQVSRKPALMFVLLMVIIIGSAAIGFLITSGTLETKLMEHLTQTENIEEAYGTRTWLMLTAAKSVMTRPLGTTHTVWEAEYNLAPHSDFFYNLGIYGIPGAGLWVWFVITIMFTVKRIPLGYEKFFSRAIVTFLLVAGLGLGQIAAKHYWILW